jgi:hypothetical protein
MSTSQPILIQPQPNVRRINYVSKTFSEFRQNLIEFSKAYFPNTYTDFNETSPGMMFIEMAAYLGDVMSFYVDNQFKENLLEYADQPENIIALAQFLGYKPRLTAPASTVAELSIIVPRAENADEPNSLYLPIIGAGSLFGTSDGTGTTFRLLEDVDFRSITNNDYTVNFADAAGIVDFVVTKPAKLSAGTQKIATFGFSSATKFSKVTLPDDNIIGIEDVTDSDGNRWYEVDFLAQDVVMDTVDVTNNGQAGMPPFGLRLRKVPRRFVTRITRNFKTELMFGSGETNDAELNVSVDSRQIATSQYGNTITNTIGNVGLNNVNFLNSYAYGLAPANTTLTVRYVVGGGAITNANAETISTIKNLIVKNDTIGYSQEELNVFNTTIGQLAVTNPLPATGGGPGDSLEEIRENALAYFNAQNRVVTSDDYVVRTYAMPARFGQVAKAYALRDEQLNSIMGFNESQYVQNDVRPTAVNLYTLGYNNSGKLTQLNNITKENLARYLNQYRLLTDDINILDAFIINIGVNFNIRVFKNYNMRDVTIQSVNAVQTYFDINNWSINQPIILSDLIYQIGSVPGVQTVDDVTIFNKYRFRDGSDYQLYKYDIGAATINGIVYPSLDPSIFELRYPQTDIIGNATQ